MMVRDSKTLNSLCLLLSLATTVHPQILVNGVADKVVYNDRVTFTIMNAPGYVYGARLDGNEVPIGTPTEVNQIDYHELFVTRTNTATSEWTNQLVRFIVAATERNGDENGLPPWTPYPMIPSTSEEVAGGQIRLLVPVRFPAGMEIPAIAWIENATGGPLRGNGQLVASGDPSIIIRRGVGSGFLGSTNAPGVLVYAPQFVGLTTNRSIEIETNVAWTVVGGMLSGNVTWPDDSRISVTGDLTLTAGSTLAIGPGSVVRLSAGKNIIVAGHLLVKGTPEAPVVFAPVTSAQPWGGFFLTNNGAQFEATSAIFTGSGADPNAVPNSHRHEQCLFYCDNHIHLNLTNCAAIDLAGQFGHAVDRGQPWNDIALVRTLIQRCTTGGEWNGSSIQFLESALVETPYETDVFNDGDEDGIYFTTGQFVVKDSLIGWTRDDGIDSGSGSGGTVTVSNTWVESTYHEAFAWSGGDRVTTNLHTVCLNCGQGIECGWSSSALSPNDFADDCLSIGNLVGARFGDNYNWTYTGFLRVTNSLLLDNYRDVWGRNWQDWTYRSNAMDIQGNFLSTPNAYHPNNSLWDPVRDGWRLASFMTTPPNAAVGVGLAVRASQFDLGDIGKPVPVRLSSFTTNTVSVGYSLEAPDQMLAGGTLQFAPGETLKFISLPAPARKYALLRLRLGDPVRAQITGQSLVWFVNQAAATNTILVPTGAVWKYLDTGTNAGTIWREPGFDDSAWRAGDAELGYGDTKDGRPETTVISYGPDANNKYITYYFRHTFVVMNQPGDSLTVQLKRDDGGIVYLNGKEIFRSNITNGPADYLTRAYLASDDGAAFYNTNAPASLLVEGTNTLAVEIHQESPTSSDISFDLALEASPALKLYPLRFGEDWLLSWDDRSALLEEAEEPTGPWSTLQTPSPASLDLTHPRKFYRLRKPR